MAGADVASEHLPGLEIAQPFYQDVEIQGLLWDKPGGRNLGRLAYIWRVKVVFIQERLS
jgi:hypothetical protein